MESFLVLKICFAILLTGDNVVSIMVGNEKSVSKPNPKIEDLEWLSNFGPYLSNDERKSSRYRDTSNSLCPSGITGQFPYPPDCKRFVNCWKGRGMIQVCGPGTLFNPATGQCDYPDKVKCAEGDGYATNPQPLTARFPNSRPGISPNSRISRKDKENYQVESFTIRPYPGRPPYFGPSHLTRPTPRPTIATGAKIQEKVECPSGFAGLYPHPTDCTRFLNCWAGRMFIQKCGPGTYFNPELSVCDHAHSGNCQNDEGERASGGDVSLPPQIDVRLGGEDLKEDYTGSASPEIQQPAEDLYNSATNLFEARTKVEEDKDTKKPVEVAKKEEDLDGEEKKDRDPTWGKILNWNSNRNPQANDGRFYYDAHGNPVNPNQFWTEAGKAQHHNRQFPSHHTPETGQNPPGDSNVYYLRPHQHVMNQNPPHLQNNWAVRNPVFHNPQSFPQIARTQPDRPPASNPYFPSAPLETVVPGHFILVEDNKPVETKVTHDSHQKQHHLEEPPRFLVPPRADSGVINNRPIEEKLTENPYKGQEEPSRVLLPPRVEDSKDNPTQNQPSRTNPFPLDYNNWKPYYNGPVLPSQNAPQVPSTENQNLNFNYNNFKTNYDTPFQTVTDEGVENPNQKNWKVQHDKGAPSLESVTPQPNRETTTSRNWWGPTVQNTHANRKNNTHPDRQPPKTTYDNWSPYYGNRDPYGLSSGVSRTFSAATEPTPTTTTTTSTTTTTGRVYVVYPVKNHEHDVSGQNSYQNQNTGHYTANQHIQESSQKLKGSSPKKATEEDYKKRIKSEVDVDDSQEDLNVRDVEMYTPTLEDLLPNAGKDIRLRPLSNHLDGYIEMKKPNGEWGMVCDRDSGWMINEANVVCREFGYGRGAQLSWQGYPLDSSSESIPVSVSEVTCNGNEESLKDCLIKYGDYDCDITKNAVGLRCFDNVTTQCHPEEVEFNNSCYRLVKREDLDDVGFTLEEAADYCNRIGGRITDVVSEEENDFLSQWLMEKHPDVRSVLTGGIGSAVMGRSLWMWFGSEVPMRYQKWWKGWADEKKIRQGTVHEPSCVVLRKSYPCFVHNEDDEHVEIELGNLEPEYCSANYFYWDVEECKKLRDLKLPHLCKKPLEEIGCVVGRGENYSGTASITSSGVPCLPWDHPEVKERLAHQITLQEWSTKLSGHNFCRNLGRQELHPWCFVAGKENSEYCSIPQCWDSVPGYSKSATIRSSCDATQFECRPGECIKRNWFCDGKKDCSNGRDEAMCSIFLQEFTRVPNKRMKGHGREKWPEVNENSCAKLCLENKKFKCKSFSFQKGKKTCLLSDTNMGLSGQVISAEGWTYSELSVSSLNCSIDKGLIACKSGKCVNVSNICDGKDNCEDGSDEVDCGRLGYQIRLAGSNETNKGRVEVKVLGKWGAVCDDKFNLQAGEVVCRELGFHHGVAEVLPSSHFPADNPIFLVDDLQCLGNETSLRECKFPGWGRHDCKPEETVGVVCRIPEAECPDDQWHCKKSKECIPIRFLCDSVPDCNDHSDEDKNTCDKPIKIRLAGGPNSTAGRLEIQHLGTWGTICDDNFNDAAASVICRILGYHGPSYALKNSHFGPGKGPIWLDGVQCFGNETDVNQCDHSEWGKHNCKHDEDISISCSQLTNRQKSSARKPIAASSDANLEQTSKEKLKRVLLRECSEDENATLQSVPLGIEPRARVVGSDVVQTGIPWQASIRVRSPGGKSSHWCGAIVISPYHILTAGHCLRDYSKPAYFIRVGDFDTEVKDPEEREFEIDHMYIHPEFNRKLHLNNDVALVKVKGEIPLDGQVRPACLAPSPDIYLPGTNCSISGWGSISPHSTGYARTLRRAYVPILEPSLCKAPFVYGDNLSDGMFCAGKLDGGVDSCQGDSGGPIMCQYEGKLYLYGVTSWGHGCGRANKPGVYTNVAYYSEWIQEKIEISLA